VGPSSSKVGATSSDKEDNGEVQVEDNTLRRRKTTLARAQSKSSLLDSGTRELDEHSRSPLPSRSARELAGSPGGSLPSASVQELVEQNMVDESLEELGRLAADLNYRLELQKQKSGDRGSDPTGALFGPRVVRPASGSGPTSGFYEPQVVRPILEQEVRACGPTDSVPPIRIERETPSVSWSMTSRTTLTAIPVALTPMGYWPSLMFLRCSIQLEVKDR